ncbi:MAG: hypothetical protein ACLQDY_26795 [Streptosporangiaceae bacterium]
MTASRRTGQARPGRGFHPSQLVIRNRQQPGGSAAGAGGSGADVPPCPGDRGEDAVPEHLAGAGVGERASAADQHVRMGGQPAAGRSPGDGHRVDWHPGQVHVPHHRVHGAVSGPGEVLGRSARSLPGSPLPPGARRT